MKVADLKKFVHLRDSLVREKAQLVERLRHINLALGAAQAAEESPAEESPAAPAPAPAPAATRRRGRRGASGFSLREAVLRVTAKGALTKEQILSEVKAIGYEFTTKNPLNSLGVILYGKKPKFRNDGGKFSPVGGSGAAASVSSNGTKSSQAPAGKKRQLSAEARARISAAQKERWAKRRAGQ